MSIARNQSLPGRHRWPFVLLVLLCPGLLPAADAVSVDQLPQIEEHVEMPPVPAPAQLRPNFSGAWQKDFARSDRWEDELQRQLEQMQRDAARGYVSDTARTPGLVIGSGSGRARGGANIVELAQLTGFINRQNTLRIQQTAAEIRIERTGDADLECSTEENISYTWSDDSGEEVCGWEGRQLLFRITLPEGVQVLHRFSVSDDGQWLNMATTTSSARSTFTQIQFFYYYDSPNENYSCIQTISRGNRCSLNDSLRID